jgi:hypothetical protein
MTDGRRRISGIFLFALVFPITTKAARCQGTALLR